MQWAHPTPHLHSVMQLPLALALASLVLLLPRAARAQSPVIPLAQRTWMDTTEPPAVRARKLLSHMNFTEKTMMLSARDSEDDAMGFYIGMVETSHRLGMPWLRMDQNFQPNHPGKNTNWPGALTIGASFDRQMARLWGESMGAEVAAKGANVWLEPGLCIARLPLNGRNVRSLPPLPPPPFPVRPDGSPSARRALQFEYLSGEDPMLGYEMIQPAVRGIQSQVQPQSRRPAA